MPVLEDRGARELVVDEVGGEVRGDEGVLEQERLDDRLVEAVPATGPLGYIFFLLDKAVQRGTPGRQDESASFLRSPSFKDE